MNVSHPCPDAFMQGVYQDHMENVKKVAPHVGGTLSGYGGMMTNVQKRRDGDDEELSEESVEEDDWLYA